MEEGRKGEEVRARKRGSKNLPEGIAMSERWKEGESHAQGGLVFSERGEFGKIVKSNIIKSGGINNDFMIL